MSELVSIQVKLIEETKQQKSDNVAIVIFTEEKDEQNALLAALDSKYDALREKLLIEALMAQVNNVFFIQRNFYEQCYITLLNFIERLNLSMVEYQIL